MNIQHHTHPDQLERYSFVWSEVRLLVAALALFIGGVPPIYYFLPGTYGVTSPFLHLAWLISGAAALYLLYRWNAGGQTIFGGKNKHDLYAFFVSVISGINLGLVGILGQNIGMSISTNRSIFAIVGVIYLVAAWHLYKRWKTHGERVF